MLNLKQIEYCLEKIGDMFPHAECELVHSNPFELVVAVALSAQCTDALVNRVTKTLFQKYKRPKIILPYRWKNSSRILNQSACTVIKPKIFKS